VVGRRDVASVEDEWLCGRREPLWKTRGSVRTKNESSKRLFISLLSISLSLYMWNKQLIFLTCKWCQIKVMTRYGVS